MIENSKISQAVSKIPQRAERQRDISKIVSSYVDVGILSQLLDNNNNQVLFGRRGTGKTHILKMYENYYEGDNSKVVCYIDSRCLGSSPQFSDTKLPVAHRCSSLFMDVLKEISEKLLNHIVDNPNDKADSALESLIDLSSKPFEEIKTSKKVIVKNVDKELESSKLSGSLGLDKLSLGAEGSNEKSIESEKNIAFDAKEYEKIIFPDLLYHLSKVLNYAGVELLLVIDEWSAIPYDIQPYLAEFLKKSLVPISDVTIKIGALEYRTNFTIPLEKHNYIGFELGSDISTNLDIDEYYVYDRNPKAIVETFLEILYKHISSELPEEYFEKEFGVSTPKSFLQKCFSGTPAFTELVRASEGVARDFINIFHISFFDTKRKGSLKIDKKTVVEAGRAWFESDKAKNLDNELHSKLRLIIDDVIGTKKARSFLVSRELERHPIIQKLFDARVIHLVKKGYSDKDNPGIRYNVYSLDYGTYVDLINTTKQPELDYVETEEESEDIIVPFDDKRSIRRIILSEDILN